MLVECQKHWKLIVMGIGVFLGILSWIGWDFLSSEKVGNFAQFLAATASIIAAGLTVWIALEANRSSKTAQKSVSESQRLSRLQIITKINDEYSTLKRKIEPNCLFCNDKLESLLDSQSNNKPENSEFAYDLFYFYSFEYSLYKNNLLEKEVWNHIEGQIIRDFSVSNWLKSLIIKRKKWDRRQRVSEDFVQYLESKSLLKG